MKLLDALTLAERIRDALATYCDQIAIVGSIRRARDEVNDIDVAVLPAAGKEPALRARCKQRAAIISEGPKIMTLRLEATIKTPPTQLDIFFAHAGTQDLLTRTPSNWGIIELIRTGSRDHNIYLCAHAESMGLKIEPQRGVIAADGTIVASETEREIFHALGLEWVPPALRERAAREAAI